jgi:hypothetical protein
MPGTEKVTAFSQLAVKGLYDDKIILLLRCVFIHQVIGGQEKAWETFP